ncbi:MAG: 5-(carboxyamino)imidazole ribonucleotide synthase [Candidatus Dormibacteria bacterium]
MADRIGCLGGGQLGRMLALAGYPLGLTFTFLDPAADAAAGEVGELLVGPYSDPGCLRRLGLSSDLVTFEFESVPDSSAQTLAAATAVFPPPQALAVAQDRLLEKRLFTELGIACANYTTVNGPEELEAAARWLSRPARLKSRRLGYDGHGQAPVAAESELKQSWRDLDEVPCILEEEVSFERELSIIGVRSRSGEVAFYPLTENHHQASVLRLSLAPAPQAGPGLEAEAQEICRGIMEKLDYCGVLAVELFQVGSRLLANEIAPRVHNSGHWTQDGALTSQFENHLRAGLGWPLGDTVARGHSAMVNILSTMPEPTSLLAIPGVHLHLYGKAARPLRKLGHVNVSGPDPHLVTDSVSRVGRTLRERLPPPRFEGSFWPG